MRLEFFIAKRLSSVNVSKGKSPAHKIAVIAVVLSVIVMISAIAIVTGFKDEIRKRVSGFNADITLYTEDDGINEGIIKIDSQLIDFLDSQPDIESYSLVSSVPILLKSDDAFKGLYLRGVEPGYDWSFFESCLIEGHTPDYNKKESINNILISRNVAEKLNLRIGSPINAYFMGEDIKVRPLIVCGIFDSHFESYDATFIYGFADIARDLAGIISNSGSMLEIELYDGIDKLQRINQFRDQLSMGIASNQLNQNYNFFTIFDQGSNFFSWLELLDTNVIVILVLMTIVSAFTLISSMLIIILEKLQFIGIMKSLGMQSSSMRKIFIWMALRIGGIGIFIGNVIAISLLFIQAQYHIIPLNAEAYYIDYVPVKLDWISLIITNIIFVIVIYLVLIIPSYAVSRIQPSKSMRYE